MNNSRNTSANISNDNIQLINILNTMYTDNNRQIQNLTESNNEIRSVLTNILTNSRRQPSRQNNNNRYNNLFNNLMRDNIQRYNIPSINQSRNLVSGLFDSFFEPVEIYPTQTQIEIATRRVRYNDIISPPNISCPISLETFNEYDMVTVIRHCGHIFNSDQLNIWFRSNCKCPVCRYDIRNYNIINTENNINQQENSSFVRNEERNTENNINQQENSSFVRNEERNTENSTQSYLNLFLDASGNLILDSTDPYVIFNLLNNLQNRRET